MVDQSTGIRSLIGDIEKYQPYNEQEEMDKVEMLALLQEGEKVFLRENRQYHMTASAWVVNPERSKVLMVYHNIYQSWSWLGGHADGETDLLQVAMREVQEESGVTKIKNVGDEIFSLEILTVDGHIKKGVYVPSHLHLNVTYLLEAEETQQLQIKPDENQSVDWFTPEEAIEASTEEWFRRNIYPKLNEKMKNR